MRYALAGDTPEYKKKAHQNYVEHILPKRESRYAKLKKAREDLKLEVLTRYSVNGILGCSCSGCTETLIDFLTLDHLNLDGAKHRKLLGKTGNSMYVWAKAQGYPLIFQTLCQNCNIARSIPRNKGVCPHLIAPLFDTYAGQLYPGHGHGA
jgi:hypothetical protein